MKKQKISFVCQECGYDSPKFMGKCPECSTWNSFKEIKLGPPSSGSMGVSGTVNTGPLTPKNLNNIVYKDSERLTTEFSELNGVLGGGIVAGSVTLLAGDPGVGKSTLLLQLGLSLSKSKIRILYISGEESEEQVKLRADRILFMSNKSKLSTSTNDSFLLLAATNTDAIVQTIEEQKPALVIIDSIQTVESESAGGLSGSVSQVRYAAAHFIRAAKTLKIPIFIVGHVTKEGMVAGPMVLTHMVDVVLFLEGEKQNATRILRSFKNRFGPVDEVGIFVMEEEGLKQSQNPEHLFLSENVTHAPGSVLTVTLEGTRAFMVEIQALVLSSKMPMPRHVSLGIDQKRLELLLAVLQKHTHIPFASSDVFVNVVGGMKLSDTAADLAICLALVSSQKNVAMNKTVAIGEVGLLGELRNVSQLAKREKQAEKLGYKTVLSTKTYKTLSQVIQTMK